MLVKSKVKVTKGSYQGISGTITNTLTIPLSQIWPLVGGKEIPQPDCSIVFYSVELENGVGVTLPLDCLEIIDE